ncbi:MAG: DUF1365 domain-containing protein [Pseudomonadota bacterium]
MTQLPALRLFKGHTTHQRSTPFRHRFRYGLSLIDIDIDRLAEAGKQSVLFSIDRPALFGFKPQDHAGNTPDTLRPWAEQQWESAGVTVPDGALRLLTFPRHWFYKFAPISIWIGYNSDGGPRAILYEVHNTFGDTHTYAAEIPMSGARHQHEADKTFHVSPFFDISGRYRFTLRLDAQQFRLIVETLHGGAQTHMATIQSKARSATTMQFAALAVSKPISSLAVTLAIHWQALKLWIKGAKYHARPTPPRQTVTRAATHPTTPQQKTLI